MYGVIDFEATGLSSKSYPIEVGVVLPSGERYQSLIKPVDSWRHWDASAEKIHGITREELLDEGVSPKVVCEELNDFIGNQTMYSDCWVHDHRWFNQLYAVSGIWPGARCSAIEGILSEDSLSRYHAVKQAVTLHSGLQPHRALNDAQIIKETLSQLAHNPMADAKSERAIEKELMPFYSTAKQRMIHVSHAV